MELDARKRKVLSAIVETYIRTGEPVGSKYICQLMGYEVSPATIRNDMAALFDMGLLEQPHTSAGRVPSHLGYRMYIDNLMNLQPLSESERAEIASLFNVRDPDPDKLLEDAADVLARQTNCAAISTTFTPKAVSVRRIELIPAAAHVVVIVIVASNGVIKNKVCRVDFEITPQLVDFFNKFANSRLAGHTLSEITTHYINSVAISLGEYSRIFTPLLAGIFELCKEIYEGQYYTGGQSNLLAYKELSDTALETMRLLERRDEIIQLILSSHSGVQVKIGKENTQMELADSSVLISKYQIGKYDCGALGIIGPVRIDYARIIPHLECFSQMLGRLLSETFDDETE